MGGAGSGGMGPMGLANTTRRNAKEFSEAEKAAIVDECTVDLYR